MDIEFVRSRFIKHFDGKTGNVYASPGRINLIGEHTDYNGGFVFPGAVDKGVIAEMRANDTEDTVMAYAIDLKDRVDFKLSDPAGPKASWARYIYGIALEMKKLGVPVKVCLWPQRHLRRQQGLSMGHGAGWSGNRAQLLRRELRYHGPVCLCIRQGRLSDAP